MRQEQMPQPTERHSPVTEKTESPWWKRTPGISIEGALYLLILLLAAALRFGGLGVWPLLDEELVHAIPPLELIRGDVSQNTNYSPLLFVSNFVAFLSLGASESVARLLTAISGTALVALPYWLRTSLGRIGSLGTSLLLAISPSFVYFSRTSTGSIIVAACALAFVAASEAYHREGKRIHLSVAVAAVAIAILAGSETYTLALIGGGALVALAIRARRSPDRSGYEPWTAVGREALSNRLNIFVFLGILILVGTAFFWNLRGFQATLNLLANWTRDLRPLAGGRAWYYYLKLLVLYELPALVLGLFGLGLGIHGRDRFCIAMGCWFGAALIFYTLLGPSLPGSILIISLPLILSAGRAIEAWLQELRGIGVWEWVLVGLCVPILALAYIKLVTYLHTGVTRSGWLSGIVLGLLVASLLVFWAWIGKREARRAAVLLALAVLGIIQIKTTVRLNYVYARHPVEPLVIAPSSPDQHELVRHLETISSHYSGDRHEIEVLAEETLRPVLTWVLRDFPNLEFTRVVPSDSTEGTIVTAVGGEGANLPAYAGMTFHLRSQWPRQILTIRDLLRWLVLTEPIGVLQWDDAQLWVRLTEG